MKIALITDTHFGARNDNVNFNEYFYQFYEGVFFPYLQQHNIKTCIHLGDCFDRRKYVSYRTAKDFRERFILPFQYLKIELHMLVGNHDIYYKNTLRVNAPKELLGSYDNIISYDEPCTVNFDGLDVCFIPWICDENYDKTLLTITQTEATIAMGHLELNGFEAHPGHYMENGMDPSFVGKFKKVFTGHYHQKSHRDNIYYLGNPYQLYWNDYQCKRGFHVFDTETLKTTFYRNPFHIFHKLHYNNGVSIPNEKELEGAFVKLIVEDKGDYSKFDYRIRQLQDIGLADLKIIEDISVGIENGSVVETEDTMTLLDSYIDEIDIKANKSNIKNIMRSLYIEASSL